MEHKRLSHTDITSNVKVYLLHSMLENTVSNIGIPVALGLLFLWYMYSASFCAVHFLSLHYFESRHCACASPWFNQQSIRWCNEEDYTGILERMFIVEKIFSCPLATFEIKLESKVKKT